ncbi:MULTISPECIES: hypothetical protein [unclassified Pseudomonas]|uniref:hypothetical protein n=1 Tax=unclassified Pseudomonas TaxID=196821 RepID=UPI002AC8FA9B|nr:MULTISPECIES: hypothetical protein [unclassified Pseudomonas]MEB0040846.1 hypothetical protein [Pseudomonas sp. MH10]MEB0119410.1 hypothetical protein [Pseudomonas sp. CCI1.2]WPX65819.1 hypothetical protein RHM59_09330 [Pseudomonas sp. MH10]
MRTTKVTLKTIAGMMGCLISSGVWAEACQVSIRPASQGLAVVNAQTCYEYTGMPAGSIDWSCSNQSKDALTSEKHKVDSCPTQAKATCSATLTQESLANERSTNKEPGKTSAHIPEGAQVVTYYYELQDPTQARIDCEHGGGTWK